MMTNLLETALKKLSELSTEEQGVELAKLSPGAI